jgi:hypothetical protein
MSLHFTLITHFKLQPIPLQHLHQLRVGKNRRRGIHSTLLGQLLATTDQNKSRNRRTQSRQLTVYPSFPSTLVTSNYQRQSHI